MVEERRPSAPGSGPRNRPSGNRPPGNRPSGGRGPTAPLTGPIVLDTATADALTLFNARLVAQAEQERAERRVQKAAKLKDDAAARIRELERDTKATAEQRAEATAAYKESVDAWDRARNGEPEPRGGAGAPAAADTTAADTTAEDTPTDEDTTAEDTPTDEPAADEAPAEGAVTDGPVTDGPVTDEPAAVEDAVIAGEADSGDATDAATADDH